MVKFINVQSWSQSEWTKSQPKYSFLLHTCTCIHTCTGAVYFSDCQLDIKIPIFLIVLGCLLFIQMGVKIIAVGCAVLTRQNNVLKLFKCILKVVKIIFHIINLVFGVSNGYFVISCFNEWQEGRYYPDDSSAYCNPVLYLFAFVFAILQLTFTVITTCVYGCYLCKICLL